MFSIIKKGIATLRSKGIKETLYWFYFGYLKVNRFFLFRRELNHPFSEVPHRDDILIKQISLEQLREIRQNYPKLPEEFFCDIFEGSKTCFVGFVGEKAAHIMWVFFANEGSRFFNLGEREAEINYGVTLPEFRGLHLYPLTVRSISHWLRENQYKWLYGAIHDKNVNAINAIRKCGFEKIGEIRHVSFWRPKWKGNS
jgi:RimJ/RimL family protein N-acetyltransferase